MNFRDTIGFGKESAATGAVSAVKSIMAYTKQIVTQLLTGVGTVQIANTTEDLNSTGTKDLYTGTGQPVILKALTIKGPTGAAGGSVTSISIQTDDATPGVIISSTLGAVANLTSEFDLGWSGEMRIDVGTKIQLTIGGGAHGSEYITKIAATYESTVAGGTLVG
jgi:hypothetical protein